MNKESKVVSVSTEKIKKVVIFDWNKSIMLLPIDLKPPHSKCLVSKIDLFRS